MLNKIYPNLQNKNAKKYQYNHVSSDLMLFNWPFGVSGILGILQFNAKLNCTSVFENMVLTLDIQCKINWKK